MKLYGKTALITGGTSGIGAETARLFAAEGAQVAITGRRRALGEALAESIGLLFIEADVRQQADCQRCVEACIDAFGRIDILFNNAGIVPSGTILDTPPEVWLDTFATNVHGMFFMTRAALPEMIAAGGGVIVNNASDWGISGAQNAAAYAASKGAVVQLTRSLALDHARQGIRVNAICPGDTYVERWRERGDYLSGSGDFERRLQEAGAAFPMGRVAHVSEIARGVLFLASDDSSYMTGQMLIIDGGNTAGGASTHYR
jgi:NAD(P)-dependent dehydrogenase (short-subunit alcohol dehydrogenase family)